MQRLSFARLLCYSFMVVSWFLSASVVAEDVGTDDTFECMIVQSKIIGPSSVEINAELGDSVRAIVIEGINFGLRPLIYFGKQSISIPVIQVGKNNSLDTMTVELPAGTQFGTYPIAIENTTGPFYENKREINPIFCFGSIDFRVKTE